MWMIICCILPYVGSNLIQHYCCIMTTRCPNAFNAYCSQKNFVTYWQHGINPSITKKLNTAMKTMNKVECNNFVIPFPTWIPWLTPHIFLTPQHNLVKEGQKDQLIFNMAKRPTIDAIPINLMTSINDSTELNCTFCMAMANFLTHLWNFRITFPNCDIAIHPNNAKSYFRQLKHHPDIMGAFSFVMDTILFLQ